MDAAPSVGEPPARSPHPYCARLWACGARWRPSSRAVTAALHRLHVAAGTVRLDDGSVFLLLQVEPSEELSAPIERLEAALALLAPGVQPEALASLHGYHLELFGWAPVPGLDLAHAPELVDALPPHCGTLTSLEAYRARPALAAWRRPRAEVRWLSRASRVVCDHHVALPPAELQDWVELRLRAVAPARVTLPLVVHVLGQLGQFFEPLALHAAAQSLYADFCAQHGLAPVAGSPRAQMLAAHAHVPARCQRCTSPLEVCLRRSPQQPCRCRACQGPLRPQPELALLAKHSEDAAARAAAREGLARAGNLLARRDEVASFDPARFHAWLRGPRCCCAFVCGNLAGACAACLERYRHDQKLQELKQHPPDWAALQEEVDAAQARLLEPPLVQAAWACERCHRTAGPCGAEAALTAA